MDTPTQLTRSLIALIDSGSIVAVVVGVAKAFEWFDGMVNDDGRRALNNQLRNAPSDDRIDSWATVFPKLIDRVFGPRPLSWKFFLRSCLASLLAVITTSVIMVRFHLFQFAAGIAFVSVIMLVIVPLSAASNLFPDYLSLLLSRTIVQIMKVQPTATRVFLLLILDTVLTGVLAVLSSWIGLFTLSIADWIGFCWSNHTFDLANALLRLKMAVPLMSFFYSPSENDLGIDEGIEEVMRVFFFSAFFTSIWVWLYVTSIFAIKLLHKMRMVWVKVMPYLDIEKKPLVAVGRVAGLLAGAGYALILGVAWIGHHWH